MLPFLYGWSPRFNNLLDKNFLRLVFSLHNEILLWLSIVVQLLECTVLFLRMLRPIGISAHKAQQLFVLLPLFVQPPIGYCRFLIAYAAHDGWISSCLTSILLVDPFVHVPQPRVPILRVRGIKFEAVPIHDSRHFVKQDDVLLFDLGAAFWVRLGVHY